MERERKVTEAWRARKRRAWRAGGSSGLAKEEEEEEGVGVEVEAAAAAGSDDDGKGGGSIFFRLFLRLFSSWKR